MGNYLNSEPTEIVSARLIVQVPKKKWFENGDREKFLELTQLEMTPENLHRVITTVGSGLSHDLPVQLIFPLLDRVLSTLEKHYKIFLSGSGSEFYIKPRGPFLNDIDLMCIRKKYVAIFDDGCFNVGSCEEKNGAEILHVRPTSPNVDRFAKVDPVYISRLPSILLEEFDPELFRSESRPSSITVQIPDNGYWCRMSLSNRFAILLTKPCLERNARNSKLDPMVDIAEAVQCINWPPEINDWLNRKTKSGWPSEQVKKEVIRNGCHLIIPIQVDTISPRLPGGKYETAISFSKAEHILVASWSPVQQFVYHLLRIFLNDLFGEVTFPVTGNYDLKTFMLWMCEEIPLEEWKENCVISICCRLLNELGSRIREQKLMHYFFGYNLIINRSYSHAYQIDGTTLDGRSESSLKNWLDTYFQKY